MSGFFSVNWRVRTRFISFPTTNQTVSLVLKSRNGDRPKSILPVSDTVAETKATHTGATKSEAETLGPVSAETVAEQKLGI